MHYGVAVYEYQNTQVYLNDSFNEQEQNKQTEIAKDAFERSCAKKENVWALRNLAIIAQNMEDRISAERYYDKALSLEEIYNDYAIVSEYLTFLNKEKKFEKAYSIYENLPENIKTKDRIQITTALAAVKIGKFDFLTPFFANEHYDVKEGENSLTDIWFEYNARRMAAADGIKDPDEQTLEKYVDRAWDECPPDPSIDFRMSKVKDKKYRI
jgi:tetratricopeptide (TPR) repeat protein